MSQALLDLAQQLGHTLKDLQTTLVTAESCTGGGLGFWITAIPGSSAWFERGFITYTNEAKAEMLSVQESNLRIHGAVSEVVAKEMASGAILHSHATYSVAVTGIAGPDGGSPEKPVGTIWIAWAKRGEACIAKSFLFSGDRQAIRMQTITQVFTELLAFIASAN